MCHKVFLSVFHYYIGKDGHHDKHRHDTADVEKDGDRGVGADVHRHHGNARKPSRGRREERREKIHLAEMGEEPGQAECESKQQQTVGYRRGKVFRQLPERGKVAPAHQNICHKRLGKVGEPIYLGIEPHGERSLDDEAAQKTADHRSRGKVQFITKPTAQGYGKYRVEL